MSRYKYFRNALGIEPISADPASPTEGLIQFSDGTHRPAGLWQYKSGAWSSIGGGGGGLDVFFTEDHETNGVSNYTSGNNATIGGAGALDGTLATETSAPLSGDTSAKYTMGSTSTNDYILGEGITLDLKQQDNYVACSFVYTYNGTDADIRAFLYDETNDEVIGSQYLDLEASSVAKRVTLQRFVTSSVATLKLGFQVVTGNSAKILIFDDIEFTTNPFQFTNLTEEQFIHYSEYSAQASTNTAIPYFVTAQANTGANILTVANDSTNGFSVTANRKCRVNMSYFADSTGTSILGISKNSSQLTTAISAINQSDRVAYSATGSTAGGNASCEVVLEAGDILRPHAEAGAGFNDNTRHGVVITAKAEVEHLVSKSKKASNDFSAVIANNGTATISSQGGTNISGQNAIASVSRTSAGQISVTFTSGFFSVAPAIQGTASADPAFGTRDVAIDAITTSGCTVKTDQAGAGTDFDFSLLISKQGVDSEQEEVTVVSPLQLTTETVRYHTHTGYGSTNTKIPYFTTEVENTLDQLGTLGNDSTNGFSVTIKERCLVTMTYCWNTTGATFAGISLNSSELTTSMVGLTNVADRLVMDTNVATATGSVTVQRLCEKDDVLRPHSEGVATSSAGRELVSVTLVKL